MKKKFLSLLCVAVLFASSLLCGCSLSANGEIIVNNTPQGTNSDKEITFLGFKADNDNLVAIERALHGFMDNVSGVNVIYEGVKGQRYWNVLDRREASGVLDDIFMIDHDHVLEYKKDNKIVDLANIIDVSSFSKVAREQIVDEDGSVYFVPMNLSAYNFYVNYDILEEHGQKVPENYAELQEVCDYFVGKGITPIIANNYLSLVSLMQARSLFDVYNTENTSPAMENFNAHPEQLAAEYDKGIDMVADMIDRGWIDAEETLKTAQTSDDLKLFGQNERPFMVSGGWATVRVKIAYPNLNYGVHAFPVLDDGCVMVMDVNTCISIKADSKYVEEAKQFVSYLMQPGVLWDYCNSQSSFMAITDSRMPDDKTIAPSIEYVTNGRSVIGSDYRLNIPIGNALNVCNNALLQRKDKETVKELFLSALTAKVAE